jgi:hypothetical protein
MSHDTLKLGLIIEAGREAFRDAAHIAVAPIKSGASRLSAGDHVKLAADGRAITTAGEDTIGIVDPYLHTIVHENDTFWLFLYPGTITNLRHSWSHPAFAEEVAGMNGVHVPPLEAVAEMKALLREWGMYRSYDNVMLDADVWVKAGRETESDEENIQEPAKFWDLYEKIRGVKLSERQKESYVYVCCI